MMKRYIPGLYILLVFSFLSSPAKSQDTLKFISLIPQDFNMKYLSENNVLLVDVREPFEFKSKRIEGAVNIPASGQLAEAADTINRNYAIFLYCTSGFRSEKAAKSLYEKGFRTLYSLKGGIIQWQKDGMKVEKKRRAKGRERGAGSRERREERES